MPSPTDRAARAALRALQRLWDGERTTPQEVDAEHDALMMEIAHVSATHWRQLRDMMAEAQLDPAAEERAWRVRAALVAVNAIAIRHIMAYSGGQEPPYVGVKLGDLTHTTREQIHEASNSISHLIWPHEEASAEASHG